MSPESQRIAIAEACGWKRTAQGAKSAWFNPAARGRGRSMFRNRIPDYLNDLNEMHEAEKVLTKDQYYRYATDHLPEANGDSCPIDATAAQRAEAFLRTIGKWEGQK